MRHFKYEVPLGGGEGSIVHFCFHVGDCLIRLAESRSIAHSNVEKKWVPELQFLDDFKNYEELKEILGECDDERVAKYVLQELKGFHE